jgi:hypothetical protein
VSIEWRWETFTIGPSQWPGEAEGQLVPGDAGTGGKRPLTKAGRAGTARRCGPVERGQKVQRERTSGRRPVTAKPFSNLADMGRYAAHGSRLVAGPDSEAV